MDDEVADSASEDTDEAASDADSFRTCCASSALAARAQRAPAARCEKRIANQELLIQERRWYYGEEGDGGD